MHIMFFYIKINLIFLLKQNFSLRSEKMDGRRCYNISINKIEKNGGCTTGHKTYENIGYCIGNIFKMIHLKKLERKKMKESPRVEIKDKILLTIEEAAAYSGISVTTIRGRLREGNYDFILKNGTKTLIKRRRFEQYLESVDAI